MNKWEVIYYSTKENKCYVEEFIDSRNKKEQAKLLSFIELLEDKGIELRRPYCDYLKDEIYELRKVNR